MMKVLSQQEQKSIFGGAQNKKPKRECPCKKNKKNAAQEFARQGFFSDLQLY